MVIICNALRHACPSLLFPFPFFLDWFVDEDLGSKFRLQGEVLIFGSG